MDTMEITKIVGAACGALLIYLLAHWAGDELYHVGGSAHGGHGEHKVGYLIEVEEETTATAVVEETPSIDILLASADISKGEKVFSKCKSCHKLEDGGKSSGPHLFSIFDRDIAAVEGFGYSPALKELDGDWTAEALNGFIESPKAYAPGTKMGFAGLRKPADRANLIAYLQTIGN